MDYSHTDRLKSLKNLYAASTGGQKNLYDVKDIWEELGGDVEESYFWMALDDSYRNGMVEITGSNIDSKDFDLEDLELLDQRWHKYEQSRGTTPKSDSVPVYTQHFRKHDEPDFDLGDPVSEMEAVREIEKGEKRIVYRARNDLEGYFVFELGIEFTAPENLSPEVEELFNFYTDRYLNKIWSDEIEELERRALNLNKQSSKASAD